MPAAELYTEAQRTHELASSAAAVGKRARSGPAAAAAVHVMTTTEQSTPQLLPPLAMRGGEVVVGAASAATPVADNGQDTMAWVRLEGNNWATAAMRTVQWINVLLRLRSGSLEDISQGSSSCGRGAVDCTGISQANSEVEPVVVLPYPGRILFDAGRTVSSDELCSPSYDENAKALFWAAALSTIADIQVFEKKRQVSLTSVCSHVLIV